MTEPQTRRGFFRRRADRLERFFARELWAATPPRTFQRRVYPLLRMGVLTVEGVIRADVFTLAAALTFQVVFALVPLLAVMLAVFKGFGGLSGVAEEVKDFILRNMAPDIGGKIIGQIDAFLENVSAAALGVVGLATLVYTALSLLHTVEKAFNRIWGVKTSRPPLRRLTIYWTILTVSPLLLALSLAMSAFVQHHRLYVWLAERVPLFGSVTFTLAPFVLSWGIFTAVYVLMPNTRVSFRAAVAGGVVAGTAWEIMKAVYVWYNARVVTASTFYGPLASIPIFLLWVYLSWVVVLLGAELAFAIHNAPTYRREVEGIHLSSADRERLALAVAVRVVRSFVAGEGPPGAEAIALELDAPVRPVKEVVHQLVCQGVLREVAGVPRGGPGLVPGRDPGDLSARDVIAAIRTYGDRLPPPRGGEARTAYQVVEGAEEKAAAALGARSLKALAGRAGSA